ncbi:MAG TPA: EAL domain-containing protein [Gaiellales bacterium]|nr:EAL domain-containing protein [Gaiellales bacterium]
MRAPAFTPYASRGRKPIVAILVTFALCSTASVGLSIWQTARTQHRAEVLRVAERQQTLASEYVQQVMLVRAGQQSDPDVTATIMRLSTDALLDGGAVPAVPGNDDQAKLGPTTAPVVRAQLIQERRLVDDMTATGAAYLAGRPASSVPLTAGEHLAVSAPLARLRVLSMLTADAALNTARTIVAQSDSDVTNLIAMQSVLGAVGLLVSLTLALALVAATRRQTAHFRSIVDSSTDLVIVLGDGGCRHVSRSVTAMLGASEDAVVGDGILRYLHPDDRALVRSAQTSGRAEEIVFQLLNQHGEWRTLEAHVTDLRNDRAIRGVVLNARDVTERVRLQDELVRQAYHDGLTGLANRSLFRDRLEQALARSSRTGGEVAVLVLDLDGFKQVNDSLGHDAGDQLLRVVADRLTETVRATDTVARFGGDEFAVLLDQTDEALAVSVARRALARLAEPAVVAGRELEVAASIGIALHSGKGAGDELVRDADVAMYAAKDAGRGRHEVFRSEMARDPDELLGLDNELRYALARDELSVHYQPEISLSGGRIVGVEALVRWTSPTRGPVGPDVFIPVAEASGLIAALGELVLREACGVTAGWLRDGIVGRDFVTWVNVSGKQLTMGGVPAAVDRALREAGLPARNLGLEVTETAIVPGGAADRARVELQQLRDAGVGIAIDDFGTGFSSLAQLRHFPVDMIKVDRSFVQGVERDSKDTAITTNVVALAHALGLVAVAEGIETEGQLAHMRTVGCDVGQGYLFSRPAPAEEITAFLAAARDDAQAA